MAPLMLSDTAMVLLRQYEEFWSRYLAMRDAMGVYSPKATRKTQLEWSGWHRMHNHPQLVEQLRQQLLQEIWLLWRFPDLSPVRHLDWHLVVDNELIVWAEGMNILAYYTYSDRDFRDARDQMDSDLKQFLRRLLNAYTQALASRTTSTGKDQL